MLHLLVTCDPVGRFAGGSRTVRPIGPFVGGRQRDCAMESAPGREGTTDWCACGTSGMAAEEGWQWRQCHPEGSLRQGDVRHDDFLLEGQAPHGQEGAEGEEAIPRLTTIVIVGRRQ